MLDFNKGNKNHLWIALAVMLAIVVIATLKTCMLYPSHSQGFDTDECTNIDTGWVTDLGNRRAFDLHMDQIESKNLEQAISAFTLN